MTQDFSELISYLDERFNKVEATLENKADKEDVRQLVVAIDRLTKSMEDLKIEYLAITEKLKRHERWIQQVAEKTGVKLED